MGGNVKIKSGSIEGKLKYPFDAMVYIDGTAVYAVDNNGNVIKRGVAGADDATVIQAAIDAINELGGGSLKISSGTYILSIGSETFIPASDIAYYCLSNNGGGNLTISGEGIGHTILKLKDLQYDPTHNVVMLWIHDYDNFEIRDLTIDGNKINQIGTYIDGAGLILTGGLRSGGRFINLELKNSLGNPIYLGNNNGGHESLTFVSNIYSHDNEYPVMFDNISNCVVNGIISEDDGTNVVDNNVGVLIYGGSPYIDRKDNTSFSGICILNGTLGIRNVDRISLSDINIDASSIINNKGAIHIITATNITISNLNITKENSAGYGIFLTESSATISNGYIDAKQDVYVTSNSRAIVSNLTLVSSYSCLLTFSTAELIAENCHLIPTVGQYMYNMDGTSICKLNSIYAFPIASKYVSQNADFSCVNSPSLDGDISIKPHIGSISEILGSPKLLVPCTQCSGVTINDYTRNSNNLIAAVDVAAYYSFRGEVTYYNLDGESHYFYCANNTDFDFGNSTTDQAFSIVCVVLPDAADSRFITGKWDENNLREWRFFLDASGYPTLQLYDESVDKYIGRQDKTAINTTTWSVLVATYDGSGICAGCKIYINGIQMDNSDYTDVGYVAMEPVTANLMVGALKNAAAYSEYYDGKMTWIGIAAKELSPDEVWSLTQRLKGVLGI